MRYLICTDALQQKHQTARAPAKIETGFARSKSFDRSRRGQIDFSNDRPPGSHRSYLDEGYLPAPSLHKVSQAPGIRRQR